MSTIPTLSKAFRSVLFPAVAAILVAGALFSWWTARQTDLRMRANLMQQAQLVKQLLLPAHIKALTDTDADLLSPDYLRLKDQLTQARETNKKCRFLYLLGRRPDGSFFFHVDSEPPSSNDYSPPGQPYADTTEGLFRVFDTGSSVVEGPVADRWGTWISAMVPIVDPASGRLIAVLGMDVDARSWKWEILFQIALPLGLMLALLILLSSEVLASRSGAELSGKPIQRRLMTPLIAGLLLLLAGFGALLMEQQRIALKRASQGALADVSGDLAALVAEQSRTLAGLGQVLVGDPDLSPSLKTRDSERLLAKFKPVFERLQTEHGPTHFSFIGPDQVVFLRLHNPKSPSHQIERFTLLEAARTGKIASGLELDEHGTILLRSVQPVREGREIIGFLELGKEIDDILTVLHELAGVELALTIRKSALKRAAWEASPGKAASIAGWSRFPSNVLIYCSLPRFPVEADQFVGKRIRPDGNAKAEMFFNGKAWRVVASPLKDVTGAEMADLMVLHDITPLKAAQARLLTLGVCGGLILLATLFGTLFVLLRRVDRGIKQQQASLRENEERLDFAMKGANDGLWDVDLRTNAVFLSPRGCEMFGYAPDAFRATVSSWNAMVHPDDLPATQAALKEHLDGLTPFFRIEQRLKTKSGDYRWVLARGKVSVRTPAGRPVRMTGTHTDITDRRLAEEQARKAQVETANLLRQAQQARQVLLNVVEDQKKAEEALQESEERYRSLYNSMNEGVALHRLVYDPAGKAVDYIITAINPAYESILGKKASAVVGIRANSLYGNAHAPYLDIYARVVATGKSEQFETLFEPLGKAFRISAFCPGKDQFATIFEDITARMHAEAEHERLMTAIDQTGEVIVITDPKGAIQFVNPAFERSTGYTREEVIGKNPRILKSGNQDDAFYRDLWQTISSGKPWQGVFSNKRKDDTLYTEEATISPVRNAAGEIVNYVAVKRDITEQLRLEAQFQQAQKMESVGRLAGGVAHDFNNMLQVILGYAEMALEGAAPSSALHNDITEIRNAARRSSDLTRQLLAFARKQTIAPRVLDLNEAGKGMLTLLQRLIGEDIALAWKPEAVPAMIKMDPAQLDQILTNLAINARDAINGVGTLTLATVGQTLDAAFCSTHVDASPGDYVVLAVSDNGSGMTPETLSHIFEPFYTTKGGGAHTGLGLATVYGIVKQNNGFITVESEPGKGTTFAIYLPRHKGEALPASPSVSATPNAKGREMLLLVEDEPTILSVGQRMLESLGYRVLAAETPDKALHLAAEHLSEIDLLITDVVMPGLSGPDLAKRLTAQRPGLKCLFVSGYAANAITDRGMMEKNLDFLPKPFNRDQLAKTVRAILDRR